MQIIGDEAAHFVEFDMLVIALIHQMRRERTPAAALGSFDDPWGRLPMIMSPLRSPAARPKAEEQLSQNMRGCYRFPGCRRAPASRKRRINPDVIAGAPDRLLSLIAEGQRTDAGGLCQFVQIFGDPGRAQHAQELRQGPFWSLTGFSPRACFDRRIGIEQSAT